MLLDLTVGAQCHLTGGHSGNYQILAPTTPNISAEILHPRRLSDCFNCIKLEMTYKHPHPEHYIKKPKGIFKGWSWLMK